MALSLISSKFSHCSYRSFLFIKKSMIVLSVWTGELACFFPLDIAKIRLCVRVVKRNAKIVHFLAMGT